MKMSFFKKKNRKSLLWSYRKTNSQSYLY